MPCSKALPQSKSAKTPTTGPFETLPDRKYVTWRHTSDHSLHKTTVLRPTLLSYAEQKAGLLMSHQFPSQQRPLNRKQQLLLIDLN